MPLLVAHTTLLEISCHGSYLHLHTALLIDYGDDDDDDDDNDNDDDYMAGIYPFNNQHVFLIILTESLRTS